MVKLRHGRYKDKNLAVATFGAGCFWGVEDLIQYKGMLTCYFENGGKDSFRHVVTHAIVEKNGALLLVKRAHTLLEGGKWALPGGFLGRDETAEQGVLRELQEETGWTGEVVALFRLNSRPDRPREDRQNVAFEFIIKPVKQVGTPDAESLKVEWIPIEKLLPLNEFAFDHGDTIERYLAFCKEPFSLPITL